MTVWYKQGVYGDLTIPARKALGWIHDLARLQGEHVFVTSIRDGNHWGGSLHYDGNAFDIRPFQKVSAQEIKKRLGENYDVVQEKHHIHIEYDP